MSGFNRYFRSIVVAWRTFRGTNPEEAANIERLTLSISSTVTNGTNRTKGVEVMRDCPEYEELRALLARFQDALGLVGHTDEEIVVWVQIVTYCEIFQKTAA